MNRGYVKVWRKSLDSGWLKNHKLWAFWSYCLFKSTHCEFDAIVGLQTVHLTPGQFIFGLRVASEETGLTIREIRTILEYLKKAGNLTIKTTNKFSIITVVNWTTYQDKEPSIDTQNDKQRANQWQYTRIEEEEYKNKNIRIRKARPLNPRPGNRSHPVSTRFRMRTSGLQLKKSVSN